MSIASHPSDPATTLTTALLIERVRARVGELSGPRFVPLPRARTARPVLRGVAAGVIGATLATLWVLAVDALRGLPFDTPATLGAHVTHAFGSAGSRGVARLASLFIGMEYAAFALVSALAALAARRAHGGSRALGALVVWPLTLLLPLAAVLALTSPAAVDEGTRAHVAMAHLAGIVVMGGILWRAHHRSRAARDPIARGAAPTRTTSALPRS
jgi:hypothetical protein